MQRARPVIWASILTGILLAVTGAGAQSPLMDQLRPKEETPANPQPASPKPESAPLPSFDQVVTSPAPKDVSPVRQVGPSAPVVNQTFDEQKPTVSARPPAVRLQAPGQQRQDPPVRPNVPPVPNQTGSGTGVVPAAPRPSNPAAGLLLPPSKASNPGTTVQSGQTMPVPDRQAQTTVEPAAPATPATPNAEKPATSAAPVADGPISERLRSGLNMTRDTGVQINNAPPPARAQQRQAPPDPRSFRPRRQVGPAEPYAEVEPETVKKIARPAAFPEVMTTTVNRTSVFVVPEAVRTLIIGNPAIADVVIQKKGIAVVTGKMPGSTNLISLNENGEILLDSSISVRGIDDRGLVTVTLAGRQPQEKTYYCEPGTRRCADTANPEDSNQAFQDTLQRYGTLEQRARSNSRSGSVVIRENNQATGVRTPGADQIAPLAEQPVVPFPESPPSFNPVAPQGQPGAGLPPGGGPRQIAPSGAPPLPPQVGPSGGLPPGIVVQ